MTLRVCLDCTTAFAVGVRLCPHCRSERNAEEGSAAALGIQHGIPIETEEDDMPKITRHGGASVEGEHPGDGVEVMATEDEDGEDVSAGSSSSTSSEKDGSSQQTSEPASPKPARKTASRSKRGQTDSSSAPSTGGGQEDGTSETGSADA